MLITVDFVMEKSVNWATVFVEATDEVSNYSRLLCLLVEQGTARMHYAGVHASAPARGLRHVG